MLEIKSTKSQNKKLPPSKKPEITPISFTYQLNAIIKQIFLSIKSSLRDMIPYILFIFLVQESLQCSSDGKACIYYKDGYFAQCTTPTSYKICNNCTDIDQDSEEYYCKSGYLCHSSSNYGNPCGYNRASIEKYMMLYNEPNCICKNQGNSGIKFCEKEGNFSISSTCRKYMECVYDEDQEKYTSQVYECSWNQQFEESSKSCKEIQDIICSENDTIVCETEKNFTIASDPTCATYMGCEFIEAFEKYLPRLKICPFNQQFDNTSMKCIGIQQKGCPKLKKFLSTNDLGYINCLREGYLKDPLDSTCTRYIQCHFNEEKGEYSPKARHCLPFHQFNTSLEICVPFQQDNCPLLKFSPDTIIDTLNFTCEKEGNFGVLLDPFCKKYFECTFNPAFDQYTHKLKSCPYDQQFSISSESCVEEHQKNCPELHHDEVEISRKVQVQNFTCEKVGKTKDPLDPTCQKYIECFFNEEQEYYYFEIRKCPDFKQFNRFSESCDSIRQENCPDMFGDENEVTTPKSPEIICEKEGNFSLPSDSTCTVYLECNFNVASDKYVPKIGVCPFGQQFSKEDKECSEIQQTECPTME